MLSKSSYLKGLQCPKYLWIYFNKKELIPEPSEATQYLFSQGNMVEKYAESLFPDAIRIPKDPFGENLDKTKEFIKKKKTLFQAAFLVDDLYSRADILRPVKGKWDIIEIKSGTKVEDVHVDDLAFQKYVYEKAGLKIRKCFLMHVNNEYVRKGKINPKKLFIIDEVDVSEASINISERISDMLKIISGKACPTVKISPECDDPYECPMKSSCFSFLPPDNVLELHGIRKLKAFSLIDSGVLSLSDVPEDIKISPNNYIQQECVRTGKPHVDKAKIKEFLDKLKYPLYYFDFESFGTAIPLFDGVKPYQQIPFQFSLHVQAKKGSKVKHVSFLASGVKDPRKALLDSMKKHLGSKGDIIAYCAGFEKGVIKKLAEHFPKEKKWAKSVLDRFVDLAIPFKKFYYHNPSQKGSASLKDVLPALTGKKHSELDISEGGTASRMFLYSTHGAPDGSKATDSEVKKIRKDLEKYCELDTEGMVLIVRELGKF
jgi:hypothetical protein